MQEQFAQPEGWAMYPPLSEIDEELKRLENNAERNMQILKGFWLLLVGYSAYNLYRLIKLLHQKIQSLHQSRSVASAYIKEHTTSFE